MSFLDDLRKEADAVKSKQAQEQNTTIARNAMTLRAMLPRLKGMYKYLKDYADSLKVIQPTIAISYEIPGFTTLENLLQTDYRIYTDDPRQLSKFTFGFNCKGEDTVDIHTQGAERYAQIKEYLWSHNLRFNSKMSGKGEGVFFLEPVVPVSFEFFADVEKAAIRLRVKNMDGLGASTFTYNPDKLNKEYMDELARFILRRPNKFDDLSGNRVSDDTRRRLREQLETQRQERDRELTTPRGEPMRRMPRPKKKSKKPGLFGGLFKTQKKKS